MPFSASFALRLPHACLLAGLAVATVASLLLSGCIDENHFSQGRGRDAWSPSVRSKLAFGYPDDDTLRIATWNVEHFVDAYDNPYVDHPRENAPSGMARRVDLFVEGVRTLDADVLVLQEFESEAFAETLAEERFPDMGYQFIASSESPSWYMNVVVLSRLPLGTLRSYDEVTTPIVGNTDSTGAPEAQRLTNHRMWIADVWARSNYTVSIAGAHLKAGRGARNAGWRMGQIQWLRAEFDQLLRADPKANLLVAGDLNALPDSRELAVLLGMSADARGAARFVRPFKEKAVATHPADTPSRQLDYLLPSTTMAPEMVEGSFRVVQWRDAETQAMASDHLPVVGTFLARDR